MNIQSNAQRKTKPEFKRSRKITTVVITKKPEAAVLRFKPRPPAPQQSFEDIFGFDPRLTSAGEHMLIIRTWMHQRDMHPIPEDFTITQFASAIQWQILPRWKWQHFLGNHSREAREFLQTFSRQCLSSVVSSGGN